MSNLKYFRIDAIKNFESQHLVISSNGNVESTRGNVIKCTKISKKKSFFNELDGALILDFKMMNHYIKANNYYHISVIYDDDTEESHFYLDNLFKNSQMSIRSVLMKYLENEYLIDAVFEE